MSKDATAKSKTMAKAIQDRAAANAAAYEAAFGGVVMSAADRVKLRKSNPAQGSRKVPASKVPA